MFYDPAHWTNADMEGETACAVRDGIQDRYTEECRKDIRYSASPWNGYPAQVQAIEFIRKATCRMISVDMCVLSMRMRQGPTRTRPSGHIHTKKEARLDG